MRFWPFTAKADPLQKVSAMECVAVRDDDIMIITAKQILTVEQKLAIERGVRGVGIPNRIVILDEGLQVGFARRLT